MRKYLLCFLISSGSAFATGKSESFKCMSTKGSEIKSAKKASQCHLPNHWVKKKDAKPVAKATSASRPRKGH